MIVISKEEVMEFAYRIEKKQTKTKKQTKKKDLNLMKCKIMLIDLSNIL
jgi:hypothetical protein